MKTKGYVYRAALAAVVLAVAISAAGCGRETRKGATEIPHSASDSGVKPLATGNVNSLGNHYSNQGAAASPTPAGTAPNQSPLVNGQRIAEAVAALDEVRTANVLVTGRSAYVAVSLHYGSGVTNAQDPSTNNRTITDVTDQLKTKIADKVKATDPSIGNVFVSANPDFVQRMNVYAQDIKNGKPVAGFIKEFYTMIERIFPSRAGSPGR